jgi:hypothetical protein
MKFSAPALALMTLLFSAACSRDKTKPGEMPPPRDADMVKSDLRFEVEDASKLSAAKAALNAKVQVGEEFSFKEVTRLFVEEHKVDFEKRTAQIINDGQLEMLQDIAGVVNPDQAPEVNKNLLEKKLEAKLNKDLIYNLDSSNLFHAIKEGRLQCHSGTSLYQAVMRHRYDGHRFTVLEHHVVIHETGHVLPGYLKQSPAGQWELFGLETTASGPALKVYGPVASLQNQVSLVLLANDWTILEIFKKNLKKNKVKELTTSILARMSEKYGFQWSPQAKLELERQILASNGVYTLVNSSPLGFGRPNTPAGDRPRQQITVQYTAGATAALARVGRAIPREFMGAWKNTLQHHIEIGNGTYITEFVHKFMPGHYLVEIKGYQRVNDEEKIDFVHRTTSAMELLEVAHEGFTFKPNHVLNSEWIGMRPDNVDLSPQYIGNTLQLVEEESHHKEKEKEEAAMEEPSHRFDHDSETLLPRKHKAKLRNLSNPGEDFEVEHDHRDQPIRVLRGPIPRLPLKNGDR